jgi:acetate kinase
MILVLNCGSQSVKWKIFNEKLELIKENKLEFFDMSDFERVLTDELLKIKEDISLIGHRVVHGGEKFRKPTEITDENLDELEKISHLAPLHNPYNILGIKICKNIFKKAKQIAVFDTEFFVDLPEYASTYALPESVLKEFKIRRYGFQGISHEYVSQKAAEKIGKPIGELKIITCHLGGGASISAIKNGKAIDTSMGFTPLEGLVMMTRPGNIDAGIILYLIEKFSIKEVRDILNKESGIKGVCGESDMLKLLKRIEAENKKAELAFDIFVYSIKKYIGAYFAILGGCDVLVFTGSVGSGNPKTREAVCKDLNILSNTEILAIETDEELAIAQKIRTF